MLCIFYVEPERVLNKQDQKLHEIRESRQSKIALESFLMHGHDIVCPSVCLPACPTVPLLLSVPLSAASTACQVICSCSNAAASCCLRVSVRYKCVALARLYFCAYLG